MAAASSSRASVRVAGRSRSSVTAGADVKPMTGFTAGSWFVEDAHSLICSPANSRKALGLPSFHGGHSLKKFVQLEARRQNPR